MTTTPSSAVLAASATFVEQLYARFLYRSASVAEVEFWAGHIANGTLNAAEVSASFLASAEFQQAVDPVVRLYFTAFGRIPDAGGLQFWSGVASGLTPHEIGTAFAGSPEFQQLYGKASDEAFLDTLYQNAFKRAPDAGGKQFWLDLLAKGESRADIVVAFSHSNEMTGAMGATVKVVEQYFGVHAVAPTAAQVAAALATLDPVALLTKLYASDAYTGAGVPFLSRAGVVADGYVKGATVTMTVTETIGGVETTRTVSTVTDDKGRFDFGDQAGFGELVQTGGIDIATGAAVNGSYRAVAGSTVINPLTTLVAALAADGKVDAAAAEAMVKARLGIDESVELGSYDPIAVLNDTGSSAADHAAALQVQGVLAQVNTVMGQAGAVLAGAGLAGGADGGANAAVEALSQMIQNASAALDLASAATAAELLKDSAALARASAAQQAAVDALASAAGTALANLNTAIAGAADASGGTALSHLIGIAQVQAAAEAIEAAMTSGVRAGNVSDSVDATTGAALATAIANAAAKIGDVNGDGRGDGPQVPAPAEPGPGAPPAPPTFMVSVDAESGQVSFSGTARGNITFSVIDDQLVFERGGLKSTLIDPSFGTLTLGAGQQLALASSQLVSLTETFDGIDGPGSLALTVDQPQLDTDLGFIETAGLTVAIAGDLVLGEASLGSAAVTIAAGATLHAWSGAIGGARVSGAGNLYLTDVEYFDGDLDIAASLNVVARVGADADVSGQGNLGAVDEFVLTGGGALSAAQADGATLTAAEADAYAMISGSDGSQRIDVSGLFGSLVEGGGGADQITLAAGQNDAIALAFGRAPAYQQQTLTLGGLYETGEIIEGMFNGHFYRYIVTADDLAQTSPMQAIGAKVALAIEAADPENAVNATVDADGIVTVTANALNQAFTLTAFAFNRPMSSQDDRITLAGSYEAGDTINVNSDVYGDVAYTVTQSDLTDNDAAGDPAQMLANITENLLAELGSLYYDAYIDGDGVIVISADGPHVLAVSAENATPVAAKAQESTVTLAGTYEEGDTLSILIDDIPVEITVAAADLAGDVLANLATKAVAALNQQFDSVLTASSDTPGVIKLVAQTAGTGFDVYAAATNFLGQGQQDTITLSGTYEAGDKIDVTVNGTAYSYTVSADDLVGDANAQIAAKLAPLLAGPPPFGHTAQASGSVITIYNGMIPGAMTVIASASNRPAVAQQDSITLAGTFMEGDLIDVFIQGHMITVQVAPEDLTGPVLDNLATKLAAEIAMFADIRAIVQNVDGATITLAARVAGTPYTLEAYADGGATIITATNVVANRAAGADTQVLTHENTIAYVPAGADTQQASVVTTVPNQVEQGADDTQSATQQNLSEYVAEGPDTSQSVDVEVTVPLVPAPHSNLAAMDVITGFTAGSDVIMLGTSSGAPMSISSLERLADVASSNNLQATLSAVFSGNVEANAAAIVVINAGSAAGTYLYVNDEEAAYSATNDIFIKLVGVVGLGDVGSLDNADFFSSP